MTLKRIGGWVIMAFVMLLIFAQSFGFATVPTETVPYFIMAALFLWGYDAFVLLSGSSAIENVSLVSTTIKQSSPTITTENEAENEEDEDENDADDPNG